MYHVAMVTRCRRMCCVLHVLELIYEALGEIFNLINVEIGRFDSQGDTLRRIQDEKEVNRTFCKHTHTEYDVRQNN